MTKKLGHYEVVSELGRGGMGVVYKAYEPSLDRHVAIKVLSDQMANDAVVVARFQREARSVAALNHPHITQIFFIGENEGQHYFVMEFVEGESLSAYIRREHPLPVSRALTVLKQAAEGLAAAHAIGVVHRDIKPANIMLDGSGRVKITDFGIAYTHDLQNKLTATGQFLGTPGYLSPEVCMGETADARTDIFSLGVVFFEMLTGKVPFHADSPLAMLSKVVREAIPNVSELNAEVEPEIQAILTKMVEKVPDNRYQSCADLITDIETQLSKVKTIKSQRLASATAPTEAISIPATLAEEGPPTSPGAAPVPPPPVPLAAAGTAPPAVPTAPPTMHSTPPVPPAPVHSAPPAPPVARQDRVVAPVRPPANAGGRKRGWLIPVFLLLLLPALAVGGYFAWEQFKPGEAEGDAEMALAGLDRAETVSEEYAETSTDESRALVPDEPEAQTESHDERGGADVGDGIREPGTGMAVESAAQVLEEQTQLQEAGPESTAFEAPNTKELVSETKSQEPPKSEATGLALPEPKQKQAIQSQPQNQSQPKAKQAGFANSGDAPSVSQGDQILGKPLSKPVRDTPSEVLPKNTTPQVVLVVNGDSWIGDTVATQLQAALQGQNFDLIESDMLDDLSSFLGEGSVQLGGLSKAVRAQGGDILVLAEIKFLGERELRYMGRSSTAYKSALAIRAVNLANRKSIGSSLRTELEYTQLNASQKAEEASSKLERKLVTALRQAADELR